MSNETRNKNVGASDYSKHKIQPWDIWKEYNLNPWDADIVKRVLRTKSTDPRELDYQKIIHICQHRLEMLEDEKREAKKPTDNISVKRLAKHLYLRYRDEPAGLGTILGGNVYIFRVVGYAMYKDSDTVIVAHKNCYPEELIAKNRFLNDWPMNIVLDSNFKECRAYKDGEYRLIGLSVNDFENYILWNQRIARKC